MFKPQISLITGMLLCVSSANYIVLFHFLQVNFLYYLNLFEELRLLPRQSLSIQGNMAKDVSTVWLHQGIKKPAYRTQAEMSKFNPVYASGAITVTWVTALLISRLMILSAEL